MSASRPLQLSAISFACLAIALPNLTGSLLADDWSLLLAGRAAFDGDWLRPFTGAWVWEAIAPDWPYYDYFRPFIVLSFGLDDWLWGGRAVGLHVTNLLIHMAASFGVYAIAGTMRSDYASHFPLIAGLLFALHPIHEYSVLWISGRTDTLCAVFYFWSIYCGIRFVRGGRWGWCVAMVLACAGAICSKEMAFTLPVLFGAWCLIFAWAERGEFRRGIIGTLAVGFVAGVFALYRVWLFSSDTAFEGAQGGMEAKGRALFNSVRHLVLPFHVSLKTIVQEHPIFVLVAVGCVLAMAFYLRRRIVGRVVFFGAVWTGIALAPVMNLYMPWYMYIPSAGFCLALGWVLAPVEGRRSNRLVYGVLVLVLMAYFVQLESRAVVWRQVSALSDRFVEEYSEKIAPGEDPVLVGVPGSIADVPVFAHNLGLRLQLELGDERIDPFVPLFTELPVELERQEVVVEEVEDYRLEVRVNPEHSFIMPLADSDIQFVWGRWHSGPKNNLGMPVIVRIDIDDVDVRAQPFYAYDRGELIPIELVGAGNNQ